METNRAMVMPEYRTYYRTFNPRKSYIKEQKILVSKFRDISEELKYSLNYAKKESRSALFSNARW